MIQEDIASRLVARVVHSGHVRDASFLYALAKQEYLRLRDTCLPHLPEFDARNPVDGSTAVELCLSVRTGAQAQHVDRGLFKLVTGELDTMRCLRLPGLVIENALDLGKNPGAAVLIPGMTSALLLSRNGDVSMPPLHSADIPPGQQLTVIAVKLRVDLPVRALCWTSLQQALSACFALRFDPKQAVYASTPKSEPQRYAGSPRLFTSGPRAPTDTPTSPTITHNMPSPTRGTNQSDIITRGNSSAKWQLTIITATGDCHHINHLSGMSTIQELYVAATELDGTPFTNVKLYQKGDHLAHHVATLQDAGVANGDMIQMLDRRCSQFKWQLYIKSLNGRITAVQAEPTSTVQELKAALRAKTGIPINRIILVFAGRVLEDDEHTLLAVGLSEENTLHLVVRLTGY